MQKTQYSVPLKILGSEPAAKLKSTEGKPLKVLLIDADHRENYLISKMIAEAGAGAFALEYTDRLSIGLERLARRGIDVLLLAPGAPDSHGLESLARVRSQAKSVPVVMLSEIDDEMNKAEALKRGAQEYLVKGKVNSNLLVQSLHRAVTRQQPAQKPEQKNHKAESSEAEFNNIIRNNPDGIIIIGEKGTVRFVNPAVESLFGCRAEQLLGESLDFLPTVESGKTELSIGRGDGEKRVAEIRVVPIKHRGETAYLASLRDITERKQAEENARLVTGEAEAALSASIKVVAKATEEARLARKEAGETKAASAKAVAEASEQARLAKEEAGEAKKASAEANKEAEAAKEASARAIAEARLAIEEAGEVKEASAKAVAKASKEAKLAKEKAEEVKEASAKAVAEAGEIKKASAKAVAKANKETTLALEEAKETKKASARAVAEANELTRSAQEEAEEVKKASAKAVARANEEARLALEEAEEIKKTSARAVTRASKEARLAKEEAEEAKLSSARAVAKATEEAKLARQEAGEARLASTRAIVKANEEMRRSSEEAEEAKLASTRAIAKVHEEARLAIDEADEIKKASARAVAKANEESRTATEEAEEVKKSSTSTIVKANEETRMALEEAERVKAASARAVAKANEEVSLAGIAREEAEVARAVSEEAIARAEEKIRNLDPMQSEFMSNIVHELRAPLHSILAFTKLILEGEVSNNETQKEFLTIISDQSEHLRKLINELVDISPIEPECFNVGKERVAIKDLLQGSVREFYSMAKQKNIGIRENMPLILPEIEVDAQRMRQVMFNLLDNAIKFSDDGGNVSVNAEVRDGDLLVQVADQGIGIPEEAMPSLFEKFYQVKNSARAGGLGLGLYISKRIIEAHRGRIWAESTEGAGSTFSFTLPLKQDS
jgi:signal transduction histidine kinase/PAS domain-containing protein